MGKRCQIFQIRGFYCCKQARLWWPICFYTNVLHRILSRKRQFISSTPEHGCTELDPLTGIGYKTLMGKLKWYYRWWLFNIIGTWNVCVEKVFRLWLIAVRSFRFNVTRDIENRSHPCPTFNSASWNTHDIITSENNYKTMVVNTRKFHNGS